MKKQLPFDIEKAFAGAKVETRDGRPVRIVCYDKKPEAYPILALVKDKDSEYPIAYAANGHYRCQEDREHPQDLVIVEEDSEAKFADWMGCTIRGWMLNRFEWQSVEELITFAMLDNVGLGVKADQINYALGKSVSDTQALLDSLVRKGRLTYNPTNQEYTAYTANQNHLNNE